ncbi:MAG: hypothetical protein Kapaf2KO_16510 [Candidatus Kapaibacteriales bacterium]
MIKAISTASFIAITIALFSTVFAFSNTNIDSLQNELGIGKRDSNYAKIFAQIAFEYRDKDTEKAYEFSDSLFSISDEIGWTLGKLTTYNVKALASQHEGNSDKALLYYDTAVTYAQQLKDNKDEIGTLYNNIGSALSNIGRYDEALDYHDKSINIALENKDSNTVAYSLVNKGYVYQTLGNYPDARKVFQEAAIIFKSQKSLDEYAIATLNLGTMYVYLEENEKGLQYFKDSYQVFDSLGNTFGKLNAIINISSIDQSSRRFEDAIKGFRIVEQISSEIPYPIGLGMAYSNLGLIYDELFRYDSAYVNHQKGLEIREKIGDPSQLIISYLNMAGFLLKHNVDSIKTLIKGKSPFLSLSDNARARKSLEYLDKALVISEQLGEIAYRKSIYENIAEAYRQLGSYKSSLENYVMFKVYSDSIKNQDNTQEIGRMQADFENKIADIEEEERRLLEELKLEQETERRNQIQYAIISVITIIIFAIIFYFVRKNVSFGAIDTVTFIAFLLLYEFILVVTEPWVDDITGQQPLLKLIANIILALALIPLQKIEVRVRGRVKNEE